MSITDHPDERERLHRAIADSERQIQDCPQIDNGWNEGGCRTCIQRRKDIKDYREALAALDTDDQPSKVLDPYLPYILDKAYKLAENDPAFLAIIIAAKAAFAEQLTALMDEQSAKHPVQNLLWKTTSVGDSLHGVRDSSRASD